MKRRAAFLFAAVVAFSLFFTGCTAANPTGPPRDNTPLVLVPQADGSTVYENELVALDASNTSEGYLMLRYSGTEKKVKILISTPDGTTYTYPLSTSNDYHTFPLSCGNGTYKVSVYENIPNEERSDLYSSVFSQELEVAVADEFKPFLYPNQYVNFTPKSQVVEKGEELAQNAYTELDVVESIYNFVISNISYDTTLADNVTFGYVPDVDHTMQVKKGICFDYASLMASMLRSQQIPTKLEVGYSGDKLHAWISTYIQDIGWVDNVIEFTGSEWKLMDPTLAASNSNQEKVKEYIGDGSHYLLKYLY